MRASCLAAPLVILALLPPGRADAPKLSLPKVLPMTKLGPAKLMPHLCLLRYRIGTTSPECQAYFDQGLGFFYSYVWMEAARSFETATQYDPNCAMAWCALSKAIERWGRGQHAPAMK